MSQFPTVGVVGGGQLARMMHEAAIPLGVTLRLLAATPDDAAAKVMPGVDVGDYRDLASLRAFAAGCDVVTFDHEHVPTEHLRALQAAGTLVQPGPDALVHAQDKIVMRTRLAAARIPAPRWREVWGPTDVTEFADEIGGWPVVLKVARGGYDGRGVWTLEDARQAATVCAELAGTRALVEEFVRFDRELAVLAARSAYGQAAVYPVVETVQADGICREVIAPAPGITLDHAVRAQQIGLAIAQELGVVGVLAVEMFDTPDGVLVNELAMRPHNSGHWTIEGAETSQFEQHLRAVLDLPLGSPSARATYTVMVNVLGGSDDKVYGRYVHCMARDPALHIRMYGKDVRPGRKIGHVTVSGDDLPELLERARHAAAYLRGEIDG